MLSFISVAFRGAAKHKVSIGASFTNVVVEIKSAASQLTLAAKLASCRLTDLDLFSCARCRTCNALNLFVYLEFYFIEKKIKS